MILGIIAKAFQVLLIFVVLGLLFISVLNTTVFNEAFDETSILVSSMVIVVITILGFYSHENKEFNDKLNRKDLLMIIGAAAFGAILIWSITDKDTLLVLVLMAFSGFFIAYFYYSQIRPQ